MIKIIEVDDELAGLAARTLNGDLCPQMLAKRFL